MTDLMRTSTVTVARLSPATEVRQDSIEGVKQVDEGPEIIALSCAVDSARDRADGDVSILTATR